MKINNEAKALGTNTVHFNKTKEEEEKKALENIAAMRAISSSDGSSLLIADEILSQISGLTQGIRNANDAIGILQIADSTLSHMTESADRINVLSVKLGNPTLNADQRAMIQSETNALKQSMKDSVMQASFNGKNVFASEMTFVTGNNSSVTFDLNAPNASLVNVSDQQTILDFMNNVNMERANIGAVMNGIEHGINSNLATIVNLAAAESHLQDNDIAENYEKLNKTKLQKDAMLYANSHNIQYLSQKINTLLG